MPKTLENPLGELRIQRLEEKDWDFKNTKTGFLTHSVHPYPAKFIPQIPESIMLELAKPGQTVLDPFCGSGTTLIEALRMGCNAIGIDANPLACLISRAKTYKLTEDNALLLVNLAKKINFLAQELSKDKPVLQEYENQLSTFEVFKGVQDWFDRDAILELSYIRDKCYEILDVHLREISLAAFSSIIVTVSRQDSDTRYVRREKNLKKGDCFKYFSRSLVDFIKRSLDLNSELDPSIGVKIYESNVLTPPSLDPVDLMVCSPPYPNAFSYHLYHRTRMMWLGMDQPKFKQEEIGSHRKYSSKSKHKATVETFKGELKTILDWLRTSIKKDGYACFVIGDSTLEGKTIKNDEVLIDIAAKTGFIVEANINRNILGNKKSFNPKIGKIRDEHIVVLRNPFLL